MRWWLRARLDATVVLLVLVGACAVPLWGSAEMPILRLGIGPAPFVLLLPGIAAAGIIGSLQRGHFVAEARSVRPVDWLARALVLGWLLLVSLVWGIIGVVAADGELALLAIRNVTGYVGLGLIALRVTGGAFAPASPILYAVTVAVLGSAGAGAWSWPLYEVSRTVGFGLAIALLLVGIGVGTGRSWLRAQARNELAA